MVRRFAGSFVLWYLRFFAKIQLFKVKPVVVGVGGASGKTSLSNFISIILSEKFKLIETRGKNSESGIPLSILNIQISDYTYLDWLKAILLAPFRVIFDWTKYDVMIAEMGIDGPFEPKNMSYLLKIVRPKVGVLTNISYEHSVYFETLSRDAKKLLELTAKEESKLLESLPKSGFAVVNNDDAWIKKIRIKASIRTVSLKDRFSDFFVEKTEVSLRSFKIFFNFKGKKYDLSVPQALPSHYAYSFVMAIAVGTYFDVEVEESIRILEKNFSTPPGRLNIFEGKNNTTIIDSSYNNATLPPIMDILDLLKDVSGKRRKVAILGDMRELGSVSKTLHQKLAKKILEKTDFAILIGPLMKEFVAPVLSENKHNFYSFNTFSEGKTAIEKAIKKNDVVLVKSSQNTLFLERAVEMLLKNPKDKEKLARRGKFWNRARSNY